MPVTRPMKVTTSITISKEIIASIDLLLVENGNRSEFIERILQDFLSKMKRTPRQSNDLEILNRNADRLNRETEDVLSYQVKLLKEDSNCLRILKISKSIINHASHL